MRCSICKHGATRPGKATLTLERNGMILVMRAVPAAVCQNCDEEYVDEKTSESLMRIAEDAARHGTQVEIRKYVAAWSLHDE